MHYLCPTQSTRFVDAETRGDQELAIVLMDINPLGEFEHVIHKATGIPMISIDRTTYVPGETASFEVLSGSKDIKVLDEKGRS